MPNKAGQKNTTAHERERERERWREQQRNIDVLEKAQWSLSLLSFCILPGGGHICIRQEANMLGRGVNHLILLPFTLQEVIFEHQNVETAAHEMNLTVCLLHGSLPACGLSIPDYCLIEFNVMCGCSLGSTLAESCKKNIKTRQSFYCKMSQRGCHWPLSVHLSVRIFLPILPLSSPSCPLSQVLGLLMMIVPFGLLG